MLQRASRALPVALALAMLTGCGGAGVAAPGSPPVRPPSPGASPIATHRLADGVELRAYRARVPGSTNPGPARVFVTAGLASRGQAELVMGLRYVPDTDQVDPALEVLPIFAALERNSGQLPRGSWGVVLLGPGVLGRQEFGGFIVAPCAGIDGVPLPHRATLLVAATADELAVAQEFSAPRVANLLGKYHRYYPMPWWSDRQRPSLVTPAAVKGSLIGRAARMQVNGLTIVQELGRATAVRRSDASELGRSEMVAGLVRVRATIGAGAQLAAALRKWGRETPVALFTLPDPDADGRLVWSAEDPAQTVSITGPSGVASVVTGNFVLFAAGTDLRGARSYEDGYIIFLSLPEWTALLDALATGKALAGAAPPDGSGQAWRLEWVGLPR